jgi:ABC-2 type transport system permease protein
VGTAAHRPGDRLGLTGHLGLYGRLVGAHIRSQMQYKVSFGLSFLSAFGANIIDFAAIAVLFGRIPHLAGWSLGEVGLIYGMAAVSFATAELIGSALDNFDTRIVQGTFDRVLTRPLGAFFQILAEDLGLKRLGRIGQGALVLLIGQGLAGIQWTPDRLGALLLALAGGTGIFFSIFVLGAAFCFWTVQGKEATHIVTYGGDFTASYPLDVYAGWLRRFVTFVLPLAFVNYYPALYILGREDPLGLPDWVWLLSPVIALAMAGVARLAWSAGVRRYQSTGS